MSQSTDTANANDTGRTSNGQPSGALETVPTAATVYDNCFPPNTPLAVATTAFILGSLFSLAAWFVLSNSGLIPAILHAKWHALAFNQPRVQLSFFVFAWSFFHWAEFAVTAGWNREKLSAHSFLLDNGREYHIAHSIALFEHLTIAYFFPALKTWHYITPIGMMVVLGGQFLRSMAMIHASTNFSHMIAHHHRDGHVLVTRGIYSWSRHPSYAGFFYWSIGTQIALQNPISFIMYFLVTLRFFSRRIKYEEARLIQFFGADYKAYHAKVPTRIPFIR